MSVELRPAVASDVETIAQIWYAGWHDGHAGHTPPALVTLRTPESFPPRVSAALPATTVAVRDGEVAGFIVVGGDEAEQVYVAAGHRGSGVAGVLLAEAERQIAAGGHERAWLAVAPGNARARRFYARSGWVDEGEFTYDAPIDGGSLPVVCHRYVRTLAGLRE